MQYVHNQAPQYCALANCIFPAWSLVRGGGGGNFRVLRGGRFSKFAAINAIVGGSSGLKGMPNEMLSVEDGLGQ